MNNVQERNRTWLDVLLEEIDPSKLPKLREIAEKHRNVTKYQLQRL